MPTDADRSSEPPGDETPGWDASTVARFYDEELETWKAILGPTLHYHFGVVDPEAAPDDAEAHFDHAVRRVADWIPQGARVLDVGCGWGGAARVLRRERDARLHGVTVSPAQAEHYRRSLPEAGCTLADVAELELDERFDVAMMLESFCHVDRPERALRILRRLAPRLVLLDHVSPGDSYVDTRWRMRFPSHEAFRALVRDAGYAIVHDERTQVPWVPAARHWLGNVERRFPDGAPEGQLARLAGLCRGILAHGGSPTHIHLLVAEVEA
ncbi:MAG: methyltransferase domain-containing protein [Sandaracinaceae bacterium]